MATSIHIKKGSIQLAGLLFKSTKAGYSSKCAALIIVHPGGGVKEQTAQLYASKLAEQGFATICYDASHQGESGGQPRFLEDPSARVSDIWAVADHFETLDYVDPERIGVVGICAGGGYAVAAAKADYRLKAVATVSMVNIGDSFRLGWEGNEPAGEHTETLKQAAQQTTAENKGAEGATAPYVPTPPDHTTPYDLKEAHDYYFTPRAHHPRAANKMLIRSFPLILTFDAFHLADVFLKQPVLLIAGENAGSLWHTEKLDKAIGGATKKIIVPKGTHVDFYDKEEFVNPAVADIAEFMRASLG